MQMYYATGLIKDNDMRGTESYSIIKRAIKALGVEPDTCWFITQIDDLNIL